ncbi:MAG: helix-turn-helix domain-containing protein [Oscillospiraceae bacterium]|nr:helix-turn-helix domain-containing protein [Oscillospiraceae bacterium]
MNVEIASKLVELRKKNGYSQESLAEQLGISRQAISKWERAEASPDTENLILLAKIYGISLDELFGINVTDSINSNEESQKDSKKEDNSSGIHIENGKGESVHIGWNGIHVQENDDRKVHVGWDGIHVVDENVKVNVDRSGVSVKDKDGKYMAKYGGEPVPDDQKSDRYEEWQYYTQFRNSKRNVLQRIPLTVIAIVTFISIGLFTGIWHPTWLVFFIIPIADSFITAIMLRDFHRFAYPVLVTLIYLSGGFFLHLWHPGWVVYLTIPIYYAIFPKKQLKRKKKGQPELI